MIKLEDINDSLIGKKVLVYKNPDGYEIGFILGYPSSKKCIWVNFPHLKDNYEVLLEDADLIELIKRNKIIIKLKMKYGTDIPNSE